MKKLSLFLFLFSIFLFSNVQAQGPSLGSKAETPLLDKSQDTSLTKLKGAVIPRFRQYQFKKDDLILNYNLFAPTKIEIGKKYPLVLFMADASVAGKSVLAPLEQGYGALVFATRQAQEKNPCYILVPQFSGVAVNDSYEHTPEVDAIIDLLKKVVRENAIDPSRLYTTGQSMGGMISMYFNVAYPDIFAASLFVDCHWDASKFNELVRHPFVFVSAGDQGPSRKSVNAIEDACRKVGVGYTWAEWSARLPLQTQDDLARTMLDKGQPVNLIGFENGTVLPENGKGSEHMYSFDHAYQIAPVREWLFKHSLAKPAF